MSIQKLERVMWRLRKSHPATKNVKNKDLRVAIMYECGTDDKTYYSNRRALIRLGWLYAEGRTYVRFTDKDING